MTRDDCNLYLHKGRATAAFYLAHSLRIVFEGGNRNPETLRSALDFARAALQIANSTSDAHAKSVAMRFINWLRADLAKIRRAA